MIRKIIVYLFFCTVALIVFQVIRIFWYSQKGRRVYVAMPFQRNNPKSSLKILFIGDSTAVGTGAESNEKSVAGYFGRDFSLAHIVNLGQNGRRLHDLIKDFNPKKDERYTLVVAQIGANDILHFTPFKNVERDLSIIVDRAKSMADYVVILYCGNVGAAPIFFWPFNLIYTERTRKVRSIYIKTAKEKEILYINLFEELSDDMFLKDVNRFYCPDYLHPSGDGYLMWYNKIRETLNKAEINLRD